MIVTAPSTGAAVIHDGGHMRYRLGIVAVVATMLALPAVANPWRNGGLQVQMQRHQPDRFQRQPQRDFRNQPPPDRGPRDGRMTDQERRDLHRDLDRANRELYKGRR
jgi:hypothetical protein